MFARVSVIVCVMALAVVLVLFGFFLALQGMAILPGALFVGPHVVGAAAIGILLGIVSFTAGGCLCFRLFQYRVVFPNRSQSQLRAIRTQHAEARLRVLAQCSDSGPLYSGFRPTFQYHEVVDDVTITLVGASQLTRGEDGTVLLSFGNPTRHDAYLREGCEFDILDHNKLRICSGTIKKLLVIKETASVASA